MLTRKTTKLGLILGYYATIRSNPSVVNANTAIHPHPHRNDQLLSETPNPQTQPASLSSKESTSSFFTTHLQSNNIELPLLGELQLYKPVRLSIVRRPVGVRIVVQHLVGPKIRIAATPPDVARDRLGTLGKVGVKNFVESCPEAAQLLEVFVGNEAPPAQRWLGQG